MTYERYMNGSVARLLKTLLQQRGLLIKDVIEKTGIPRPTISRHLHAQTFPKLEDRQKYAAAFKMMPEEFERQWQEMSAKEPPAPEIQRIALELPTPLFISLRAIVKDDAAIHAFIVRAVADALADAADPANDATDVTTHRAKNGLIVARVKRQKRVRGSRG